MRRIRVGIDVGGTFTKAVAIDMVQGKIIGKVTVPTTHSSSEGVSTGIVQALKSLMEKHSIQNSEIELISHSTTQAVNALLEGDTAKVGIIGMGVGLEKSNVIKRTNVKDVELAPNKYLHTCYRFLDTSKYLDDKEVEQAIGELKEEGAEVIVVSEAYGVDDPSNEKFVMEKSDIPATAGHELTGIYGLEIRTLTAAINAGILPKATSTARFVESAVRNEKIAAPVLIMKGDGGVTDMGTFQSKPIITVLSGPAASVAGALLHLRVIDGVFIEVGGTSTNVCVIKDGRPEVRYVTIMQHPTCIRSLDVRVAGVAGGSLVRWSGRKITDVGPRSAHIAGLPYSCFAAPEELEGGQIITFKPKDGDPIDYVAIESAGGKRFAITNTCAANALGLVPEGDYARANQASAKMALSILANRLGTTMEQAATMVLDISAKKVLEIVEPMIKEYKLKKERIVFIGGGGGASVLVPHIARKLQLQWKIAEHAEVISSIGVAAAMIHEEAEKTINNPKPEDISTLAEQVKKAALDRGALPESITIQSEYVSERSLLRVTAMGNVSLDIGTANAQEINEEEAHVLACELFGINEGVQRIFDMKNYHIFACELSKKKLFLKSKKQPVLVLDKYGRVRLSVDNAAIFNGSPEQVAEEIEKLLKQHSASGNDLAPQVHILDGVKLMDFSSLTAPEHVSKAVRDELKKSATRDVAAIVRLG
ncbi:hydantoinase/oxoprolinase [Candidatus Nitrososphaera gargensis Ga9.2]|uniref:Hydantoinase/oxoprolinase n=1 Tax=Nitrososphaera gargensis (strain Ga9.2) TaxID=1237085 RepID=K0IKK5_NITGG|nr:hydantoinase/oxoprolinase family protein [Candidatus Nitrososphaera gargensis]AFU59002.1 hydantoinase/oxoprolinase [Candidatus Nitrososphaera gargensis Ga9.2]